MKSSLSKLLFIGMSLSLNFTHSQAQELYQPKYSVRALSMGNAYVSYAQGTDAIFYNPANLAKHSGFTLTIADPAFAISGADAAGDASGLQSDTGFTSTLQSLAGSRISGGASSRVGSVITPIGALAMFGNLDASIAVNNPLLPEVDMSIAYDWGYALGFGFSLVPTVDMGFTFKRIQREGAREKLGAETIGTLQGINIKDITNKGVGYSADIALAFTPGVATFSFVWRDVGKTSFRAIEDSEEPPFSNDENMIFGFAADVDAGLISLTPTFDYHYSNRSDIQIGKKVHMGVEIGLPLLDLRAGFYQGYYTAGVGLNLGMARIDAGTYGVEMGAYPGQLEDRRYVIQMALELGFDGSFNFIGGAGSEGKGSGGSARARGIKRRR